MADVSVIARRLTDGHVQHGWSGNDGFFSTVGVRLLRWYNDPEMVEYLFGLGQTRMIWEPGSEKTNQSIRSEPIGWPHWLDQSENQMFSRVDFAEYGYFYDADHRWYYVEQSP